MRRSATILAYLLLIVQAGAQCPGVCLPLAAESFEYPDTVALDGLSGGSGWASPWEVQGDNIDLPGIQSASGNNLSYLDLQNFGGGLEGGHAYLGSGRLLDLSTDGPFAPYLDNGYVGAEGNSLYFAALLRKDQSNTQPLFLHLHEGNIPWYDTYASPELLGFGYYGGDSQSGGMDYWTMRIFDNYYLSSEPVIVGNTALLVARVTFGASHQNTYDFWVNPNTIGGTMPPPLLSQTITGQMRFRSVKTYLGSGNHMATLDEIRLADSYTCAVPDAVTPVNQAPVAIVSTNTNSGQVPFNVNFDASASYDSGGSIVSYEWDFGDGNTATGPVVSNTYSIVGAMTAFLTLTDNCGISSTASIPITGLDENGEFPCLASVRLNQAADHNTSNGEIQIFGGNSYTLTDSNNQVTTQSNGTFGNLPAGDYSLQVNGANGCVESFELRVPTDSTSIPSWTPDNCNLHFGINLDGVPYWNQIRAFKDFQKQSSDFFTGATVSGHAWNTGYMDEIARDAQGYPLSLPYSPSDGAPEQLVRCVISANGHMPLGQYVLLYEGDGNIVLLGNAVTDLSSPGRLEFSVTGLGNIWYHITASTTGNHIRNIRIIRPEHEGDYNSQPFYEPFLEKTNYFECLRFMDWGHTNGSEQVQWTDRKPADYHTQGHGNGIAYEYMIALANLLQKDVWVCVPHQADEDYILQMATLFRDNLHGDATIYIEYSNEVWNWQFSQAHWVEAQRPALWNHPRAYAERCRVVFETWHDVFGTEADRVKRVLATQAVNNWISEQSMAQLHGEFDYLSPTWYFGYNGHSCYQDLQALGAAATPQDVLDCSRLNFLAQADNLRQQHLNAKLYRKELIEYEGGQHMTSNPVIESFQQATWDAQIAPGIYDLYQEVIDSLRIWDSKLVMAFTLASVRESQYGSWGALEYIEQDPATDAAPKWDALIDNSLCYSPPPLAFLPVELTEFVATCVENGVLLEWNTLSEWQSEYFAVEYSREGREWFLLGEIPAAGDSPTGADYRFKHLSSEGGYYRLKMVDKDGSHTFSSLASANCPNQNGGYELFPNPSTGDITLLSKRPLSTDTSIECWDLSGRLIRRFEMEKGLSSKTIQLNTNDGLSPGIYLLKIWGKRGLSAQWRLVVLE